MSKEYKNYAVPLEAVEILFLPALRRLSRAVPRTVADISQSLSEQTHALGTKEELQDLKSDAFMHQVKATLQAMARLGYVLVVPKTTTSKTRYLLSDSGADILTAQIRRRGSVIPQSARYELQNCLLRFMQALLRGLICRIFPIPQLRKINTNIVHIPR